MKNVARVRADGTVRVDRRPRAGVGEPIRADPRRLLSAVEVARLLEISAGAWRSRVRRGAAPAPDEGGRWRLATVGKYVDKSKR